MFIVKVGEFYVQYIRIKEVGEYDCIEEILLRKSYAKKFSKKVAQTIANKINGEVVKYER